MGSKCPASSTAHSSHKLFTHRHSYKTYGAVRFSTDGTTGVDEWKRNITYIDVVGLCMAAVGVEDLQMKSEQREIDEHIFCVPSW